MKSVFIAACILIVGLCSASHARAQTHGLHIEFPTNGSTNIEVRPEIRLTSLYPIFPQSITFDYPNADENGLVPELPTVAIVEKQVESPGLIHTTRSVRGTYELVNGTTLLFRPSQLKPGTTYEMTVSGLVIDVYGGQILPASTTEFTTRSNVPRLVGCSLDGQQLMNCSESITLDFSESLSSYQSEFDRVIHLGVKIDGAWEAVPATLRLGSNGTSIVIEPSAAWPIGSILRMNVDWSLVSGDPFDEHVFTTQIRDAMKITVDVRDINGQPVPPDLRDAYTDMSYVAMALQPGDMSAIDRREDLYRFVHWESPLLGVVNEDRVVLDTPCDELADEVSLTAVVERVDTIRMIVEGAEHGHVDLYDHQRIYQRSINTEETLVLLRGEADVTLVAVPDSGYTFSSWSASHTPSAIGAAAALPVRGALLNPTVHTPNYQSQRRVIPQFTPLYPGAEQYRLKATIQDVDADPGFNVASGVSFTTAFEFQKGYQATRTVCVSAQPCWEIVGVVDASIGLYEAFDGREEYCYAGLLTDPENQITFLVRRREVQARVERVVLLSDDANDVALGKRPHAETYVRVERERTSADGSHYWSYMGTTTCEEAGISYSKFPVQCGDKLRIRARGSNSRGLAWKYFAPLNGYTMPTPIGEYNGEHRFEIVVDRDITTFDGKNCNGTYNGMEEARIRACFLQQFGVEAVGLSVRTLADGDRSTARFEERWFDPLLYRVLADDEPFGGRQIEYVPRHGAIVKVRYTMPIDVRPIQNGAMWAESYDNTLVTDVTADDLDFEVASSNNGNITYEPVDGSPITTVAFRINDPTTSPRLQALHGGSIDLTCGTEVLSLAGLPLLVNTSFVFQSMELPGYGIQLRDITYQDDGDGDIWFFKNDGEMYHAVYGGNLGTDRGHELAQAFERIPDCSEQQGIPPGECTLPHSDKDGPQSYGDRLLWMQPFWMDRTDLAWTKFSSYDEDCKDEGDCLVNRVQDLLDDIEEMADGYGTDDREKPLEWSNILPDLVSAGAAFIGALLPPDEQDDFLGEATFLEGASHWWGLKSGTGTNVTIHHPNVRYRLLVRPFVSKSVIR